MSGITDRLRRCCDVAVPIVGITTPDEPATLSTVAQALSERPVLHWDCVRGLMAANEAGDKAMGPSDSPLRDPGRTSDATEMLFLCNRNGALPDGSTIILAGAHRLCDKAGPVQALLNLRDAFKGKGKMVILLGPSFSWPSEVADSIETIDEPAPDEDTRRAIIGSVAKDAGLKFPKALADTAVISTRGLSPFGVDQAAGLAAYPDRLDIEDLRRRWVSAINATRGLKLDVTKRTLDDLGGLANLKAFASRAATAREPYGAVVLMDEGGKALAGSGGATGGAGDTSGVSQDIELTLLTEMSETEADGLIAFGVPGAGKSASAVAIAAAFGVPLIRFDLGAVKGSLVGESERVMRTAMRTIRALVGKRAFWVLTCNEMVTLKAEIRRRFCSGIWFYDAPSVDEREAIVGIYGKKYGVSTVLGEWPSTDGWTGAEIENCAKRAHNWGSTLSEAAQYIVPVTQMASEQVLAMRKAADGNFLDASNPGTYRMDRPKFEALDRAKRQMFGGKR